MSLVRVACFGISLDGYSAGLDQGLQHPLGRHGADMMEWFFATNRWKAQHGLGTGETGVDNTMADRSFENIGAWILGRNMFGPVRGPWPDHSWKGWWGDEPPYHVPAFVLTHHARPNEPMKGGTEFRFVTTGIHEALAQAKAAAGGKDVRIGGGVSTVRQYLRAQLVDELHLVQGRGLLGQGERIFDDLDLRALGYRCEEAIAGERATHLLIRRA